MRTPGTGVSQRVAGACLVSLGILFSGTAWAQQAFVTEYQLSAVFPDVQQITAGADGNMWFTESGANMIGRISLNGPAVEFSVPTPNAGLGPITQGPDGNVWFGEIGKIGKITPAGNITEYAVPASGPYGLASGPDGNVWFTGRSSIGTVGKIDPDGTITEYSLPNNCCIPASITAGPDGNLWFTEEGGCYLGKIGKITPAGAIIEFDIPSAQTGCLSLGSIRPGPDGNLWFVDISRNIWRITTEGKLTAYAANPAADLIQGPDGRLWFTQLVNTDRLGSITVNGIVSEHWTRTVPLYNLARGPDGSIWATEFAGNRLAKIILPSCSYTLDASTFQVPFSGGTFQVNIQTAPSCPWSAIQFPLWISLSNASGTGPANITLTVAPTSVFSRTATFPLAGVVVTVSEAGNNPCTGSVSIYPGGRSFPSSGGTGSIAVTSTLSAGCIFTTNSNSEWVKITSVDSTTVTYSVAPNLTNFYRTGYISAAGVTIIEQEAASLPAGLNFAGSISHIAAQENWTTTFTLVNKSPAYSYAKLNFFGDPGSPLTLPLNFPPLPSSGPLLAASPERSLPPNASMIIETGGPYTPPVQIGSAQLSATGNIDGFAIFHHEVTKQEAVLPLEVRNASSYVLAFDNTSGIVLGVALQNISAQTANIPVIIRDDTGMQISTPGTVISLAGHGHTSFVLSDPVNGFPITDNKRGTIEFDTPAGGQINALGIRFTPPNNALTTIPPLANVGISGGSIAHIASGGDGWQTTFVLVNVGSSAAQATLSFFADITGAPLSLPLSFPQSGIGTTTLAPSVTQTLAAGATLIVQSSGAVNLLTGSAQLSTTGNVSGFVIFRHNDQEAVVAMESRNANAYLLAFDNTADLATAVAINSLSGQTVNIPVTVRDSTGTQIATDIISLAPNGHYAFTMVFDRYSNTAGIRGTIEFGKPANGQIGVLGIRIPAIAHTFTTLPALAK